MTDDLNSAVARYRQMLAHPSGEKFPYDTPQQLRDDQRVIIDYALARLAEEEQREDDGPVTVEWLLANRFEDNGSGIYRNDRIAVWRFAPDGWYMSAGAGNPFMVKDGRRQLRRLIAALEG